MSSKEEAYERLALQLVRQAVKYDNLSISIRKPACCFLWVDDHGCTEISTDEMIYNHDTYMENLKISGRLRDGEYGIHIIIAENDDIKDNKN
jgi:hypothetical protein